MNDRGYGKTVLLLWRSHNDDQVVHAPIIHVAGAFTDTDETYGAYVATENNIDGGKFLCKFILEKFSNLGWTIPQWNQLHDVELYPLMY